jgi:hypothetical protein
VTWRRACLVSCGYTALWLAGDTAEEGRRARFQARRRADGTGAAAGNGSVRFRYVDGTGSTLYIYSVKGCGGAFHDGDTAALSSSSMITPVQTITGS